nr:integrase, catalytic region, zinc finger, CCHC-type, peptidase aspartic, catalytic [Tanacetum cinerariifolium]
MKSLKEKVEDKLIKQDQSLQIVHMLLRPRPHYSKLNKVAIGYKNPLCLTRAKQIQPALYNGHEILKDNHAPAKVHNTEDTLEMAEITRKRMNDKMNDPECVTHKVKISPHDYSKENFLATFTPQKQLTPKQIFWSNDLMKLKSEALKERTKVARPIKAFKVKHDAIELKNLLIANDNLIVERLSQEVFSVVTNSELNVARFTEMHVANTTVEARCLALEAELANLRDTNNHANQKELINHFSKLEINHLNLQLKYQKLKDGIGNNPPTPDKDTPDFDSVFVIGKMQASLQGKDNVIRQLKKQLSQLQVTRSDTGRTLKHYKELYDSIKITRAKHIEKVTNLTTENVTLKASVSKDRVKPRILARGKYALDVEPIIPRLRNNRDAHLNYLRHLKESVETIHNIVKEAKVVRPLDRSIVSACRYTKHSQELLEYAIGTCPQGSQQRAKQLAYIPLIRKKQTNVPVPSFTGVNSCPNASGSQPKSHVKPNKISPAKGVNKLPVEDQPRTNKSHLRTSNQAVATTCYTQNRSLIHTRHHKTPYELVHNKKPDLTFFRVFGALCYPTNDNEDLRKLQPTDDTGTFKMKAAYYLDAVLEQLVPDQFWIEEECKYDIAAMYGISHWWFQRQRFYIDRHTSEGDRSAVRTHMAVIFRDKYEVQMMMRFNEIHKFSDGTLQQIDEALDYRVKEFRMTPEAFEDKEDLSQPGELYSAMDPVTHKFNPPSHSRWQSALASDHSNQNALLSLEPRDHPKIISVGHYSNMLASSHTVKSKTDIKSHTHYPCVIARTSE